MEGVNLHCARSSSAQQRTREQHSTQENKRGGGVGVGKMRRRMMQVMIVSSSITSVSSPDLIVTFTQCSAMDEWNAERESDQSLM
jgi:hypothetical protein